MPILRRVHVRQMGLGKMVKAVNDNMIRANVEWKNLAAGSLAGGEEIVYD